MAEIIVVTSGKGGVGKTTTSAAIGTGLALKGHKTAIIDFDVGLRNLDLIMGCERRVVYDFVNVINGEANLNQALIKDKRVENLSILPASQTRDKDALTPEGVERVLEELKENFDYIVCDSPAGIEKGAHLAMYFADEAVVRLKVGDPTLLRAATHSTPGRPHPAPFLTHQLSLLPSLRRVAYVRRSSSSKLVLWLKNSSTSSTLSSCSSFSGSE